MKVKLKRSDIKKVATSNEVAVGLGAYYYLIPLKKEIGPFTWADSHPKEDDLVVFPDDNGRPYWVSVPYCPPSTPQGEYLEKTQFARALARARAELALDKKSGEMFQALRSLDNMPAHLCWQIAKDYGHKCP
jgi:hypothetical protein